MYTMEIVFEAIILKFGDQLHRFHFSQLFLQELATMDILDMVLQWSCGLTGEWA